MVKDLRLKKGETLIVNKRYTSELPEMQLLDAENNLTPETRVVFGELFDEYSQGEKMNKEQCARFVQGCTGNPCSQDDT
jgi:ubiquitin carboxyl-terminal hydrolase 34